MWNARSADKLSEVSNEAMQVDVIGIDEGQFVRTHTAHIFSITEHISFFS